MSRKLMAMMLAIGLVIGLVGGFFGGYFYNNFKAEDGGQISGGSRPPLFNVVKNPVSLDVGGLNYIASLKVTKTPTEPFDCKNYEGFKPYKGEPMPFFTHTNDTAVVRDGEWTERSTNMVIERKFTSDSFGDEKIYSMDLSKDGLFYVATPKNVYTKIRPKSSPYSTYRDARNDQSYYDDRVIGSLVRDPDEDGKPSEWDRPKIICEKTDTGGTGGGGQ